MIIVISVINAKRQFWQICNGNIPQRRIAGKGDIRSQGISDPGFGKRVRTLDAFTEIALFRGKLYKEAVLEGEDRISDLPWRADDNISLQLFFPERFIFCQRIIR